MNTPQIDLAELGFSVFPCLPGKKTPLTEHGHKEATTDAEQIERWWTATPAANIGVRTDGLVVIDVDTIDGSANPWLADQPDKLLELAAAPMSLTPRGGRHYWFKQPVGANFRNTASKLAPGVDTRANGGYVVAPGSKLADGRIYKWAGEPIDVSPDKLPDPPFWLLKLLYEPGASVAAPKGMPANRIPEGQRNAALVSLAGAMRRYGMAAPEIHAALERANLDRCVPPVPADEVRRIAEWVETKPADAAEVAIVEHHAEQDTAERAAPDDPGELPPHLLTVPGFVGDVVAHNLATAFRPQPVLALAGALCLLATLTGRKIRDAYDTRTNLFCIGTADTSAGKEHARKINKSILQLAGLLNHLGPESFASGQGIVSAVEAEPAILFQVDEIGRHLATFGDARQPYLYAIPTVLMRLFTSSSSTFIGDAYADVKKIKTIEQPHAVVWGTTTPEAFYQSLSNESIYDGFMSRLLVFEGGESDKRLVPQESVPAGIIDQAKWWGDFKPGGTFSSVFPQPRQVDMTPEAEECILDLDTLAENEKKRLGKPLGSLWPRAVEKANKLALLYACSANAEAPVVDLPAAKWACAVVDHLTRRLVYLASRWFAENRQEGNTKRVARIIEAAGPAGISKSELTRQTQWLTTRERNDVLATLIESGDILPPREVATATRPKTVYIHRRYAEALAA